MELYDMNLTDIIAATKGIAESSDNTKLTMSVLVLVYLLGRDCIKYLVPLLKDYLVESHKSKLS